MTIREQALRIAITQLGATESPAGTNSGPQVNEYLKSAGLGPGFPWCMAFVHWCYRGAGLEIEHPNEASVGFFQEWAKRNGFLVSTPARGDIVCYNFDADNWPDHVGIVEEAASGRINTVEGNTAIGNDANGGMVMRRSRSTTRCVFARIPGVFVGPGEEEAELTKERILALEDLAGRFVNLGESPGTLPELDRIIFWACVRSRMDGGNDANATLSAVRADLTAVKADLLTVKSSLTAAESKIAAAKRDLA